MSAAACGCLQLKIRETDKRQGCITRSNKCQCGRHETLFPIPLIKSYCNVVRLYYGKTMHDPTSTWWVCIFPSTFHAAGVPTRGACHNTNVFPLSQVASASTGWGASLTCVWTPGRTHYWLCP